MTMLKDFAKAAAGLMVVGGGLTFILGAYAFVQNDDERVRLEDEARFGRGVVVTRCNNMTPNDPHYQTMGCEPL